MLCLWHALVASRMHFGCECGKVLPRAERSRSKQTITGLSNLSPTIVICRSEMLQSYLIDVASVTSCSLFVSNQTCLQHGRSRTSLNSAKTEVHVARGTGPRSVHPHPHPIPSHPPPKMLSFHSPKK
ncbi:unnamed protein product [Ixodes pacificus]